MNRIRLVRSVLFSSILALVVAAHADHAPWSSDGFDPFADESGYVELVRVDDGLALVLQAEQGSLPAVLSGDYLPLDESAVDDVTRLDGDAVALYGGLDVDTGAGWAVVQLEGDADAIHDAILARLTALGMTIEEDGAIGGPVRSYLLSDGGASWRIAISGNADGALVHLQDLG